MNVIDVVGLTSREIANDYNDALECIKKLDTQRTIECFESCDNQICANLGK
jgi:hypothetical protein